MSFLHLFLPEIMCKFEKVTGYTAICRHSDFLFFNYKLSFNSSRTAASSPFTVSGNIGNTLFTISTVRDV